MPLEFTTSKTDSWVLGLFALCVYIAPTLSIVATVLYVSPSGTLRHVRQPAAHRPCGGDCRAG